MKFWPSARYGCFVRAAIDVGVDIVDGHSAHIIQGVETYDGGLYDTGDFLDDYSYPARLDLSPVVVNNVMRASRRGTSSSGSSTR